MRRSTMALFAISLGLGCERSPVGRAMPAASVEPAAMAPPALDAQVASAPAASSSPPPASASGEAAAAAPASAPLVTVDNIGMHIGGGPNDAATKAPIGSSVAPHFGELRACWAQVADPARGGDFGIDLLIPAEGGRAAVSHPRTNLHPDTFRDCVVAVFTAIDFARPKTGRTTVSYSLRFTPADAGR